MRVSGSKDVGFSVSTRRDSQRVFLRFGFQRYACSSDEAAELIKQLAAAVHAQAEGREFVATYTPETEHDDGRRR